MTAVMVLLLLGCVAAQMCTLLLREHERLVVTRRGQLVAIRGPGLVLVRPFDRTRRLSLLPWRLGPLVARSTTVEGHEVTVTAVCLMHVDQPDVAARHADPHASAARVVEDALTERVTSRCLSDLVGPVAVRVDASTFGVVVDQVDIERVDVRLTADVLAR